MGLLLETLDLEAVCRRLWVVARRLETLDLDHHHLGNMELARHPQEAVSDPEVHSDLVAVLLLETLELALQATVLDPVVRLALPEATVAKIASLVVLEQAAQLHRDLVQLQVPMPFPEV